MTSTQTEWIPEVGQRVRFKTSLDRFPHFVIDKGGELRWVVRFDVTDLRDSDLFLRPGGGVQAGRDPLGAGRVPDPDWLDSEAEAISEFWEGERLKRVERNQQARSRARRQRAA